MSTSSKPFHSYATGAAMNAYALAFLENLQCNITAAASLAKLFSQTFFVFVWLFSHEIYKTFERVSKFAHD